MQNYDEVELSALGMGNNNLFLYYYSITFLLHCFIQSCLCRRLWLQPLAPLWLSPRSSRTMASPPKRVRRAVMANCHSLKLDTFLGTCFTIFILVQRSWHQLSAPKTSLRVGLFVKPRWDMIFANFFLHLTTFNPFRLCLVREKVWILVL